MWTYCELREPKATTISSLNMPYTAKPNTPLTVITHIFSKYFKDLLHIYDSYTSNVLVSTDLGQGTMLITTVN